MSELVQAKRRWCLEHGATRTMAACKNPEGSDRASFSKIFSQPEKEGRGTVKSPVKKRSS